MRTTNGILDLRRHFATLKRCAAHLACWKFGKSKKGNNRSVGLGERILPTKSRRAYFSRALRHETLEARAMFYGGHGLEFNIAATPAVPQAMRDAFQVAANQWSSMLTDDIVVNVTIDYTANAAGVGQTLPASSIKSLTEIRTALTADQRSLSDITAVSHLPAGDSAALYTTQFSTGLPIFDNNGTDNNMAFTLTRANAKAMGLRAANDPATDGTIRFLSSAPFDYNRADGIAAGKYDFIGVAAHELGHLLGFVSGADSVDSKSRPNGPGFNVSSDQDNQIVAKPLDLFRVSAGSIAVGADFDLRADKADKFFSIDDGATNLASFSTGAYNGNGRENQHWKDGLGLGIMNPTLALGKYANVTTVDVQALDVIGWDVEMDYGDAPDLGPGTSVGNYQSTLADNGPRHITFQPSGLITDPLGGAKVFLGTGVDFELDGQGNANATGDDQHGINDETGVAAFPTMTRGSTVLVSIASSATSQRNAQLNYFVDFNQNGNFNDPGEAFNATLTSATQLVPIAIPAGANLGDTFARFRISTAGGLGPTGPANDGEVEDYKLSIVNQATWQGTPNDDQFAVWYSSDSVSVSLLTNTGTSISIGTYALDTTIVLDGFGGNDQIIVGMTPDQLGVLSTNDVLSLNFFVALPTGSIFNSQMPFAAGLKLQGFETARVNINDHSDIIDITAPLALVNDKSQIQIGRDDTSDTLHGSRLTDLIFGQGGDDIIEGLEGNDYLFGGAGNDTLDGGLGIDRVVGGSGQDVLKVRGEEATNDVLFGGSGLDAVVNDGNQPFILSNFDAATNSIERLLGNNQPLLGTDGPDVISFMIDPSSSVSLIGLLFVGGRGGNDRITGGFGQDFIYGGDGDDVLVGMDGVDGLYGEAGNDTLIGGNGNDYLLGGDGIDQLTSGNGNDFLIFSGDSESLDVITDFAYGLDRIVLQSYRTNYAMLTFDTTSEPGNTIMTLPNGKKIRFLKWSQSVGANQFVF